MSGSATRSTVEIFSLEDELREFVLARERVACPDCDIRGDLASYPDVNQGKPLKVRPGKHGAVKRCRTCNGRGYVPRGAAATT